MTGAPRPAAVRQLLAVRVGAREAAVVRAVALGSARDEERHRRRRTCGTASLSARRRLREHEIRAREQRDREGREMCFQS